MTGFTSLRMRLVAMVLVAIAPAWVVMYLLHEPVWGLATGLLALAAAWYGGEKFVLRQVRALSHAAQRLAVGDLRSRAGLPKERGEIGDLARTFDAMAEALEKRIKAGDDTERKLLHRALQQTVLGGLGQFAIVSSDMDALLEQAVILVAQTLELEYSCVLDLPLEEGPAVFRTGVGWKNLSRGQPVAEVTPGTQIHLALMAREPVVVEDMAAERRFTLVPLFQEHGMVSGMMASIAGRELSFGV